MQSCWQGLFTKDQDQDFGAKDQDKDFTLKDQDKDQDLSVKDKDLSKCGHISVNIAGI